MTLNKITILTFITFLLVSIHHFAQPGSLDFSFNPPNANLGNGNGANGIVKSSVVQPDGKMIIAGEFTQYNGITANLVCRLNSDGSIDHTFNSEATSSGAIEAIALQSDGKILIGGSSNSSPYGYFRRLNTDGSIDMTFPPNLISNGFYGMVKSIVIQTDGKILVGGYFDYYDSGIANRILRLNDDGSIDSTFNPGQGFNNGVRTIALQTDGKILVGGEFSSFDGTTSNRIVRLNDNGTLDNTFNTGSGADFSINDILLLSDNKVMVVGSFSTFNGSQLRKIVRLENNGTIDNTFINDLNNSIGSEIYDIAIEADGHLIVSGDFQLSGSIPVCDIARLNSDGSLNNSLSACGNNIDGAIYHTTVLNDQKLLISGWYIHFILRLHPNGSIDGTFNPVFGVSGHINAITSTTSGKIIVGGRFRSYNGVDSQNIAQLNEDGTVDAGFQSGSGFSGSDASVNAICQQADEKIIIGGYFQEYNGIPAGNIVRLNSNGTLDNSFSTGTGFLGSVNSICVQPDGKIILGGDFLTYNGTAANSIIRLLPNGDIDNGFTYGNGINGYVSTLALQADGKIIVAGDFDQYNGSAYNSIIRLNTDGSIDPTFDTEVGIFNDFPTDPRIRSVAIQSDGKLIIGGYFAFFNGTPCENFARLHPDGSLDASFTSNSTGGINGDLYSVLIQPDNKIIAAGWLNEVNGITRNTIVRLNPDGSVDQFFNSGDGADAAIYAVHLQQNGKVLIGGSFTNYNGTDRNRITRLNDCFGSDTTLVVNSCGDFEWNGTVYSTSGTYTQTLTGCNGNVSVSIDLTVTPETSAEITADGLGGLVSSPGSSYQWINCSNNCIISGATASTFIPAQNGEYAVVVSNGACTSTSDCFVVNNVSANEEALAEIQLYPNPTSGIVHITSTTVGGQVEVLDNTGRCLISMGIEENQTLNLEHFGSGIYLVRITVNGKQRIHQIIRN